MKVSILATVLLGANVSQVLGANSQEDEVTAGVPMGLTESCVDCFDDVEEARDCLRICNDADYIDSAGNNLGSLLAWCLDESQSNEDIDDIVDCCDFSRSCDDTLTDIGECLGGCLDPCIRDTSTEYLDCVQDETGSSTCSLGACVDALLGDDVEEILGLDDLDFELSDLDLEEFDDTIEDINIRQVESCRVFEDFVEGGCGIGDSCCEDCEAELSYVMDCLINNIAIPLIALEFNMTLESCEIKDDCSIKRNRGRELSKETMARVFSLPATKRGGKTESIMGRARRLSRRLDGDTDTTAAVEACENEMTAQMMITNVTHATTIYMECVAAAVIMSLEGEETGDSASSAFAYVAAAVVSMGSMYFM